MIHPTVNYGIDSKELEVGGHLGLFYLFEQSLVGFGFEYSSVHSSSYVRKRLTKSEASTSIFFGSYLGKGIYLQNELAKGLANSRDFGFALTVKFVLN